MKLKCFGVGLAATLSALIYGLYTNEWETAVKIIGISAAVPLLITGTLTGAFVSGDRHRANYHTEVKGDRNSKSKRINGLLVMSAPNAVLIIILIVIATKNN
ncbi:DUF5316 family protein [Halobacillus sp. B23F22_1]|uniref:DUF5316 family protein n=1 Tax=Halobacillus sp. B23F22_1 TaxID=3459514 RepID=UPI00373FC241